MSVFSGSRSPPRRAACRNFLQAAIDEAKQGLAEGGIPIGSVIAYKDTIIGRGHNMRVQKGDPLLYGEMSAFQQAGRQPASVYRECVLYTTLSPCPMCSGTSLLYKIPRIVIGENVTFLGAEDWRRIGGRSARRVNCNDAAVHLRPSGALERRYRGLADLQGSDGTIFDQQA